MKPRLTPEEYKRACDLGFNPDALTLEQLGKVRYQKPAIKGLQSLANVDGVIFAGTLDSFLDFEDCDADGVPMRTMGYQPELISRTPEPPPRPTVAPEYPEGSTTAERFAIFNDKNPHIRNKLRRMALELKRKGHDHYGIKALIEVLRWDYAVRTRSGGDFKINNAFATPYAHLLMAENPELRGFFKTRQRKETQNV